MHWRVDAKAYFKRPCSRLDVIIGFFKFSGLRAIYLYRIGHKLKCNDHRILPVIICRIIRFSCQIDIELTAKIGFGLRMPHTMCIMIGGKSIIGNNCTIMQGVTIGGNFGKEVCGQTQPILNDNVFVGPGSKVLGPVTIGENTIIGANSVITKSSNSNVIIYGVNKSKINSKYYE